MRWKRPALTLLTAALLAAGVSAEDLYVKNKLFKGATAGSGTAIAAHAESLLKALGVTGYRLEGMTLVIGEKSLALSEGPDGPMVGVQDLAKAIGGKMVVSKELGTIDVFQSTEKMAGSAEVAVAGSPSAEKKPAVVNATQPFAGANVNLSQDMTYGKVNIVLFQADW